MTPSDATNRTMFPWKHVGGIVRTERWRILIRDACIGNKARTLVPRRHGNLWCLICFIRRICVGGQRLKVYQAIGNAIRPYGEDGYVLPLATLTRQYGEEGYVLA